MAKIIVRYEAHRDHAEPMKACIVACFDPRFKKPLGVFYRSLGLRWKDIDPVIVGGGAARNALSKNKELRDDSISQAIASVMLHRVPAVYLTNHIDCGALGGSPSFGSKKRELSWHKRFLEERLQAASEKIAKSLAEWKKHGVTVGGYFIPPEEVRNTYPKHVTVKTAFFDFDGVREL